MGDVTVRAARVDDEDSIWMLARELATSFTLTRTNFRDSFDDILHDRSAVLLVAVDDKRVVGYVHALAHRAFHADGSIAWVEELIVEQSRRGHGVGRLLMDAAESWARDAAECTYLSLATRRAADFYGALGYTESASYFRKILP